jgi:hypothetical protein
MLKRSVPVKNRSQCSAVATISAVVKAMAAGMITRIISQRRARN